MKDRPYNQLNCFFFCLLVRVNAHEPELDYYLFTLHSRTVPKAILTMNIHTFARGVGVGDISVHSDIGPGEWVAGCVK